MNTPDYGERFYWRIRRRMLEQNKNWLAVICGDTGSGKSYSALSIANAISPRGVSIKRNVVFTPAQFMSRLQNPENLQKADIIIFDEAGVGMSSRNWYNIQNKLLGAVLQTFRHLNVGVIFTVPNLSFVDVQARKLFHQYYEADHIDYDRDLAFLRVYDIQHNSRLDKTYYKHPKFRNESGALVRCRMVAIPKISEELAEEYERVKAAYTKDLNERALQEMLGNKETNPKPKLSEDEIKKKVLKSPGRYTRQYQQRTYIDRERIRMDFGISRREANLIKRDLDDAIPQQPPRKARVRLRQGSADQKTKKNQRRTSKHG